MVDGWQMDILMIRKMYGQRETDKNKQTHGQTDKHKKIDTYID